MKTDITKIINPSNHLAVYTVLAVAKQDAALENAIKTLNELSHIHRVEFTAYGQNYGLSPELLQECRDLQDKLKKAKYGKY
jgi:hypothetical protein